MSEELKNLEERQQKFNFILFPPFFDFRMITETYELK